MTGGAEQDGASRPSVQPVDALMTDAGEKVQGSALCGEKTDERHLGNGDPSGPESDIVQKMGGEEGRIDAGKPQDQKTCVNKGYEDASERNAAEG
jgi:hypothetical protein